MSIFKKVTNEEDSTGGVPERLQYKAKEAARLLDVSERKLADYVKEGLVKSRKVKGLRFFPRQYLLEFVYGTDGV